MIARKIGLAAARVGIQRPKSAGQHLAKGRILFELVDHVGRRHAGARDGECFIEQLGRCDARGLQAHEAFDDERQRQNGAGDEGPDGPACSLYDRKQESLSAGVRLFARSPDYGPP
jgi:hypothetical protein